MKNPAAVYIQAAPADITVICKIMEGFEHLGVVTTLDRSKGLLVIRATPDTRPEVLDIVGHLPVPCLLLDQNNA